MQSIQMSRWLAAGAGVACLIVAGIRCGDGDPTDPTQYQACQNAFDSYWPVDGNLSVSKPARCPVKVAMQNMDIPFAAAADFRAGSVALYSYEGYVTGFTGLTAHSTHNDVWATGNNRYYLNLSGDYWAATGGFSNNQGFDTWHHKFLVGGNTYTLATTQLTYTFGNPGASANGPGYSISPYGSYSVTAYTDDPAMMYPINWDFYVDGSYIGSSGDGSYWLTGGAPGTQQTVWAVITDANGLTHTGTTTVTMCPDYTETC